MGQFWVIVNTWGKRRTINGTNLTPDALDGVVDNRGFTGHEMLDQLDLVHMNGRVYDPSIGRFITADPLVGDPVNGQSYNRYSYVLNNPTNLTDPSGFDADCAVTNSCPSDKKPDCTKGCEEKDKNGKVIRYTEDENGGGIIEGKVVTSPTSPSGQAKGNAKNSANNFTSPTAGGGSVPSLGRNYDSEGNYLGPRAAPAEDRSFVIGEKRFVPQGGTAHQQAVAEAATRELMQTPLGKEKMLPALEARRSFWFFKVDEVIDMKYVRNDAKVLPNDRDTIHIDPYYRARIDTTKGPAFADFKRMLWHEFGHSALGIDDNNYMNMRKMENIIRVENVLMRYINEPERIRYDYQR